MFSYALGPLRMIDVKLLKGTEDVSVTQKRKNYVKSYCRVCLTWLTCGWDTEQQEDDEHDGCGGRHAPAAQPREKNVKICRDKSVH